MPSYLRILLSSLLNLLRGLFLRGLLRRWWIQKRARQLDRAYLGQITSIPNVPSSAQPHPPAAFKSALRRILFIGDCMWEQEQLFPEIRKICELEVLDLNPALKTCIDPSETVVAAIRELASRTHAPEPDLILFYARPSLLSEEAFSVIRQRWSCPLLGMNLDDRVEFFPYGILRSGNDNYARWIKSFDLNLTSSLAAADWYRAKDAAVRYMPQGFCPDSRFSHPPGRAVFQYPFTFVGSWKPERGALVEQLDALDMAPQLFGKGWKNSRWAEDPQAIFRGSQINLGIGYALASARIANAKGRDIECPAVGACYLTTYHWELAEMFEIGKEVLCYRNLEELVEMLAYYGKRPDACLKIAQAAHKRAHAQHTWEMRLRDLFKELSLQTN
jgi:hypothetical protein